MLRGGAETPRRWPCGGPAAPSSRADLDDLPEPYRGVLAGAVEVEETQPASVAGNSEANNQLFMLCWRDCANRSAAPSVALLTTAFASTAAL